MRRIGVSYVTVALAIPSGWTAQATSPTTFSSVGAGQTAQTTWQITVPTGLSPGSYQLSARTTFEDASGAGDATAQAHVAVPYASLSAAFDNPCITDDSDTTPGNFDGRGLSYSEQPLQSNGLTSGATVSHDGLSFSWPSAAPGTPENVVASGQTIDVSGSGKILGLLGTGDYGTASGTGTVTYTDGTTKSFALSFSDLVRKLPPSPVETFSQPSHTTIARPARPTTRSASTTPRSRSTGKQVQ